MNQAKPNNWYVITGGPSSGKTTLILELEKLGHKIIHEAARAVIDEGLKKRLSVAQIRGDEQKFQMDVLERKLSIETLHNRSLLTFFDRGMHDTVAYLRLFAYEVSSELLNLVHKSQYKLVFLLESLPEFVEDYARTETIAFRQKIYDALFQAYHESGHTLIHVPAMPVNERVQFILTHVREASKIGVPA